MNGYGGTGIVSFSSFRRDVARSSEVRRGGRRTERGRKIVYGRQDAAKATVSDAPEFAVPFLCGRQGDLTPDIAFRFRLELKLHDGDVVGESYRIGDVAYRVLYRLYGGESRLELACAERGESNRNDNRRQNVFYLHAILPYTCNQGVLYQNRIRSRGVKLISLVLRFPVFAPAEGLRSG